MRKSDRDKGLTKQASSAIAACSQAYAKLSEQEGWYWHMNLKRSKGAGKNYMLPTLEALSLFFAASESSATESLETIFPASRLITELEFAASSAEQGFSGDPYLPVTVQKTNFVETAGKYLSVVANVTSSKYLTALLSKEDGGAEILEKLVAGARSSIEFLISAGVEDKGRMFWAATDENMYQRDRDSPYTDLTHVYFSLCALSGLFDILRNAGETVNLRTEESGLIRSVISKGISGIDYLHNERSGYFSDNRTNEKDDVIPTVFALEALFRVWSEIEIATLSTKIQKSVKVLVDEMNQDKDEMQEFNRDADLKFYAKLKAKERLTVKMDDHTTLGSLTNALALGLDNLPMDQVTAAYYDVMDASVSNLLDRFDEKTSTWKNSQTAIWYSARAVESLVLYEQKRPIDRTSVTARELVQMIRDAIQSDLVVEALAKIARRSIEDRKSQEGAK